MKKPRFWKLKPSYLPAIYSDSRRSFQKTSLYKTCKKYPEATLYGVVSILGVIFLLSAKVFASAPPITESGIQVPQIQEIKPLKAIKKPKVEYMAVKQTKPSVAPNYASGDSVWDRLAQCESGGNWAINSGNGFYGGLQFDLQTWQSNGGSGYPHENSREEQIRVAERLRANRGYSPWPSCSAQLGLR